MFSSFSKSKPKECKFKSFYLTGSTKDTKENTKDIKTQI